MYRNIKFFSNMTDCVIALARIYLSGVNPIITQLERD